MWGQSVKLLIGLAGSGLLAGWLYASDSLTQGEIYDKPFDQAYAELSSMPARPFMDDTDDTPTGRGVKVRRNTNSIDWHLMVGETEVAIFTAQLQAVDKYRTRVKIDFKPVKQPASDDGRPNFTQIQSSALMTDFARIAMAEQVDARLDNRVPDMRAIYGAMGRHLGANPAQLGEFGLALEGTMNGVADTIRGNSVPVDPLPPIPTSTVPPTMQDATRPSVILPSN